MSISTTFATSVTKKYISRISFTNNSLVQLFGSSVGAGAQFQRGSFVLYITEGSWNQDVVGDYPTGSKSSCILMLDDSENSTGQFTSIRSVSSCSYYSASIMTDTQPMRFSLSTQNPNTNSFSLYRNSSLHPTDPNEWAIVANLASYTNANFTITLVTQGSVTSNDPPMIAKTVTLFDERATAVNGGTALAKAWQNRILSTSNPLPASLPYWVTFAGGSTNTSFTLQAGFYSIQVEVPGYGVNGQMARLTNITTATAPVVVETSQSSFATLYANGGVTVPVMAIASILVAVSLTAPATYKVEHFTTTGTANYGLGIAAGVTGITETYTVVRITKDS
jgi:hypothetical protein